MERLKPIASKSDSMPLYENNNNNGRINGNESLYSFKQNGHLMDRVAIAHDEPEPSLPRSQPPSILDGQLRPYDDDLYDDKRMSSGLSTAFASFKSSSSCLDELPPPPASLDSYGEISKSRTSLLPPPSPCYENASTNGFHTPKTPDSLKSNEYFLYSRPTSPLYERFTVGLRDTSSVSPPAVGHASSMSAHLDRDNGTMTDIYSSPAKAFTPTYYRKAIDNGDYAVQKVTAKPPINVRTHSLQYRKSYSHPAQTIFECSYNNVKPKVDRTVKHYYNPSTNYYDPSEIGYMTNSYSRRRTTSSEMINDTSSSASLMAIPPPLPPPPSALATAMLTPSPASLVSSPRLSALERRYATLAHPKDRLNTRQQQRHHQLSGNAHSVSQTDIDYLDPLDFKVGCQTTLRSKPQIPWYELAIKKDNRRQSCPPFQVNILMLCVSFFSLFFFLFRLLFHAYH